MANESHWETTIKSTLNTEDWTGLVAAFFVCQCALNELHLALGDFLLRFGVVTVPFSMVHGSSAMCPCCDISTHADQLRKQLAIVLLTVVLCAFFSLSVSWNSTNFNLSRLLGGDCHRVCTIWCTHSTQFTWLIMCVVAAVSHLTSFVGWCFFVFVCKIGVMMCVKHDIWKLQRSNWNKQFVLICTERIDEYIE